MDKIKFTGIMPALITPVTSQGKINAETVKKLMDAYYADGVDGFYIVGGTGEGVLLNSAQRREMAEIVAANNNNRGKIIVHTGAIDSREVIELTKHASTLGVDGISSVPPSFYFSYNMDQTVDFYREMADNTDLPIIVYANAQCGAGININLMMEKLLSIPNICGAKDTRSNYYAMWKLKELNGGNINIINGPDECLLCGLVSGADAGIGATYGVMADRFVSLYRKFRAGDIDGARKEQSGINQIIQVLLKYAGSNIVTSLKAALQLQGFDAGNALWPASPLDAAAMKALKNDLKAVGCKVL